MSISLAIISLNLLALKQIAFSRWYASPMDIFSNKIFSINIYNASLAYFFIIGIHACFRTYSSNGI